MFFLQWWKKEEIYNQIIYRECVKNEKSFATKVIWFVL